jgi:hypothetical protein
MCSLLEPSEMQELLEDKEDVGVSCANSHLSLCSVCYRRKYTRNIC